MATGGSDVASDEVSDFKCFTCTNKTAVNYCVEFQGYLCQSCSDFHSRFPALKGHTLHEKSNSQSPGSSATLKAVPTERCNIHTTELLDMYCKDHDEVGCTTCMALTHRSCSNVHSIPGDIDVLFQASEIKDVNKNLQHSEEALKDIDQKKDTLQTGLHSSRKEADIYTVKECKDMNLKLQQDSSSCQISGSCLTEDGTLLLVDFNNQKLKRANITNMTIDGYCSFGKSPFCVCCTNVKKAVVTFYTFANFIQFVSLGNRLTPSRKVQVKHDCLGIAYKEDKLFITDNSHTIYIHDMAGNELQKISQDSSSKSLFSSTKHIAFMDSIQSTCVADYYKGVIFLDEKYHQVTSFSDFDLSGATAVCTDRRENIFVCGYNSHNVLQIGYDGKKKGIVVDKSNGLQHPQSVCFDQVLCRLIVTQNNNIVKIFDLK